MSKQAIIGLDFETGGLDRVNNRHADVVPATEIAMISFNAGTFQEISRYQTLIKPYNDIQGNPLRIDKEALNVTGLTLDMLENEGIDVKVVFKDVQAEIKKATISSAKNMKPILMAHNASFDAQFMEKLFQMHGKNLYDFVSETWTDTIQLAKFMWPDKAGYKLAMCLEYAGIDLIDAHRAMNDVVGMKKLFEHVTSRMRSNTATVEQASAKPFRETFKFN